MCKSHLVVWRASVTINAGVNVTNDKYDGKISQDIVCHCGAVLLFAPLPMHDESLFLRGFKRGDETRSNRHHGSRCEN